MNAPADRVPDAEGAAPIPLPGGQSGHRADPLARVLAVCLALLVGSVGWLAMLGTEFWQGIVGVLLSALAAWVLRKFR